jgi:hypothetical protein
MKFFSQWVTNANSASAARSTVEKATGTSGNSGDLVVMNDLHRWGAAGHHPAPRAPVSPPEKPTRFLRLVHTALQRLISETNVFNMNNHDK